MLRCRICGETYLGSEVPSQCPFCGAHRELLVQPGGFDPAENDLELTEVERGDLDQAIALELANTRFYLAMSTRAGNHTLASAYKRLARIEAEHCSLFCKLAKLPKPAELLEPGIAGAGWCEDIAESLAREKRASAFYGQASARATNPRLREVFSAISAVELDHIELDGVAAHIAGCERLGG